MEVVNKGQIRWMVGELVGLNSTKVGKVLLSRW
jgi:hypothetical protein